MSEIEKKKPHRVRRVFLWILLALVLFLACSIGLAMIRAQYTTAYQGYIARAGDLKDELSFDSTIRLVDSQTVTAEEAGKIRRVVRGEGEPVRKGDVILILDNGQRIKADFDGRVNTVAYKAGEEFPKDATLCTVADFNHVKIQFNANEYTIGKLTLGRECTVKITATEETYKATLSSIDHIGNTGRNISFYTCTIYLDVKETVHPGMKVNVAFTETLASDAVIVSRKALSFDDQNQAFVYLQAEDGSMVSKPVTIGEINDDDAQVVNGLAAGDTIYAKVEALTAEQLFAQMMRNSNRSSGYGNNNTRRNNNGNGSWNNNRQGGW